MRALEDGLMASSKCLSSEDDDNNRLSLGSFIGLFAIAIGTSTFALVLFFFRRLQDCLQMYINFYLLFLIHQLHAYWQIYANVYWSFAVLGMEVLGQDPNRSHGAIHPTPTNDNGGLVELRTE